MSEIWFFPFEEQFIIWLQSLGLGTTLQTVLLYLNQFFSMFGEEMVAVAVMGFVYWSIDKRKGERIGAAIMLAGVMTPFLKNIFKRLRPYQCSNEIKLLRNIDGYSFPSGHSSSSGALFSSLAVMFKESKVLQVFGILIPFLVAFSRIYLGAHWPTDVVVGLAVGFLCCLIATKVIDLFKNKYTFLVLYAVVASSGFLFCKTNDFYNGYGLLIGLIAGMYFEEKFVNFENTNKWYISIIRTVIGAALYFGINSLLKAILAPIFAEMTLGYFVLRTLRYALNCFILVAIYPMLFKLENKIFK
ncbi:MAG: phosphatase PAP2 family protein [Erysipelotrichia bacterium]|nr:phosphatase PAP2 family protein [Erysipelotrichia bacterium]